ncbi:MAG: protease pro-enzyme activation domain-containing protein, partial [Candidatus Sulfotelmatobacter sp.]
MSTFSFKSLSGFCKAGVLALLGACSWLALTGTSTAFEKAVLGSPVATEQVIQFNVYLPVRDRAAVDALIAELQTPGSPAYHKWLTPAQFNEQFGPSQSLVNDITHELAAYGLLVIQAHAHSLVVSGTVGAINAAFGTTLVTAHFSSGKQGLAAATALKLTPTLAAAGAMVAAFSGTAHMHPYGAPSLLGNPDNRESPIGGYWFDDLKQAYSYPSYKALTGKGVNIGILMTPNFNPSDMTLYFSHEKLATPSITTINIEGGAPYDPNAVAETHIDITHSAGMAPLANVYLYNMPDLDDDSILASLTDIDEGNLVDVVNMSFGGPEAGYSPAYNGGVDYEGFLGIYDDIFAQGNT